ncbi:MAG: hypothetical protein E7424_02575, partial [Ruminococcaceae bacterium]|nr:hypothetical protein [Oscillospiraceae bacterium]
MHSYSPLTRKGGKHMRHASTRFAALLIAAALLLSLLPAGVFAASVDLTEIAQNEDEGLGQLYDVEDIISLSADEHHSIRIPVEGMTEEELKAAIDAGSISLSLNRNPDRPYLDSTLYPNAKPGGTIMDASVWQAQNRSAQFQNIVLTAQTQEGKTVLVADFDSLCYFYSRNVVDYSAPHNNGGAYLDVCGWFTLEAATDAQKLGSAELKIAPYDNYHTMPEIYTEITNIVKTANDNGLYAEEFSMGQSSAGRNMPYMIISDSKASVDAWLELTEKAEADPDAVLAAIDAGEYDEIRVPILYSNIHPNEIAATDGVIEFAQALAAAGIDGKFDYNILTGFTEEGRAQLETEMNDPSRCYYGDSTATGVAVPDLIKDVATYLGYLQDGNGRSGKVDLDKYYTREDKEITVRDLLSGVFFVLVPEENVDGRTYDTRTASNGYDLNRDNSFQTTPETANMQHVIGTYNPVSFTEFHGRVTDFQCEPCDPPHEPNFEYDLLAEHLVTGGEAFGIAAVANNDGYNSYVIPQRDYLSYINAEKTQAKWFDPWDDMSTSYTPQFAMLHGSVAYTVELPAYSDDTAQAVRYGCIGQSAYIKEEKLGYLKAQVKIFQRGVKNANSDAFELVGQWFCDQFDTEGAEMEIFRPEYKGEGQNGNFYPECYIIPMDSANQSNLQAARDMMVWLTRNDVLVNLTTAEFTYDGVTYPAGTMIVSMYQAKRSVANGALYDGTLIQGWPTLYSEGITSFNETRGFDMAVVAEPASAETVFAACGADMDYEAALSYADGIASSFEGVKDADVIISNASEDSTAAVNALLKDGKTVALITDGEYKGDFICKYADYKAVAEDYLLTATGVYGAGIDAKVISKAPVVYLTGVPNATAASGCIATNQVGNASWNYDRCAMELMNFDVTETVSEADVVAGASAVSGDALNAVRAGTPYIGYSSGAMRNAANVVPGFTRTTLSGAMDCLAYVTYPNETLVNASYIADGDDVMYGYGFGYFSAIPEGAVALVQADGSKTPTEGFIPAISERAKAAYEAFLDGGVLGFSYDTDTVHAALFANTLTQKVHQRDEYAYISNFIFSSLLSEELYSGETEPVSSAEWMLADEVEEGGSYVIVADSKYALNGEIGATSVTVDGDKIVSEVTDDMVWTFDPAEGVSPASDGQDLYLISNAEGLSLRRGSGNAPMSVAEYNAGSSNYFVWSLIERAAEDGGYTLYVNGSSRYALTGAESGFSVARVSSSSGNIQTAGSSIRLYELVDPSAVRLDKKAIRAAIREAKAVVRRYYLEDSLARMDEALAAAEDALANATTQEELDAAAEALNAAIAALERNPNLPKYNVTFDFNYPGAPDPVVVQVEEGQKAEAIEAPARTGYAFSFWGTETSSWFGTQISRYDFNTPITGDLTLKASWTKDWNQMYSLAEEYADFFPFGNFGTQSPNGDQVTYEYNTYSGNSGKMTYNFGANESKSAYDAAVAEINADETLTDEEKAAKIKEADGIVKLGGNNPLQSDLNRIQQWNEQHPEGPKKYYRQHVIAWHGSEQAPAFYHEGFDTSKPLASKEVMNARLDSYIEAMFKRYQPWDDIILSWDIVNEALDDYNGMVRNGWNGSSWGETTLDDASNQSSAWGTIYRMKDAEGNPVTELSEERLQYESEWIRQAFASARKWQKELGVHWKLYYNDYMNSSMLYEPKMTNTLKVLKPIYEAGNIDGYGMQARLAYAYPGIDLLRYQIEEGLKVADEVSFSEGDVRTDFEVNPLFDPEKPTRRVVEGDEEWDQGGSGSYSRRSQQNGNTYDVSNGPVRRKADFNANDPETMRAQADYYADLVDIMLEKADLGKVGAIAIDGTSDGNTFNRGTGCQIWDSSNNEKPAFFALIGCPNRFKMGKAIEAGPALSEESKYTAETWAPYAAALEAAEALKDVRIYDAEGVEAVKKATADLIAATQALEAKPDVPPAGKYVLASSIEPGKTYVIVADEQFALNTTVVDYGSYSSAGGTLGSTAVTVEGNAITSEVTDDMLWTINEATGVQAAVDGAAQYFIFAQDGRQLLRRSGSTSTAPLSLGEMNPSSQQYATWSFYQGAEPPRKSVSDEASFTMYVNSYRDNDYPFTMTGSAEGFNCPGVTRANWDSDTYGSRIRLYTLAESSGPADKTALSAAIEAAEAVEKDKYTTESVAALDSALDAAKAVNAAEDADQAAVDAAAAALNAAIAGLEAKPADRTALNKAIEDAEAIEKDKYTDETVAALEAALTAAKAVGEDADQAAVDAAAAALNAAIAGLEEKPADRAALNKAIEDAEAIEKDKYTDETVAALEAALTAAKAVGEDADQSAVDAAAAALNAAIAGLKEKSADPGEGEWVLTDKIEIGKPYVIVADGKYAMTNAAVSIPGSNYYGTDTTLGSAEVEIAGEYITSPVTDSMQWTFADASAALTAADGMPVYYLQDLSGKYAHRLSGQNQGEAGLVMDANPYSTARYNAWSAKAYDGLDATYCLYINTEREHNGSSGDYPFHLYGRAEGFDVPGHGFRSSASDFSFMDESDCSKIQLYTKGSGDPQQPADKTALNKAIEDAEKVNKDEYTDASVAALEKAIADAKKVQANEKATQKQVDAAAKAVTDAVNALEKKPAVNKDALDQAIADAEKIEKDKYTDESVAALEKAVEDAKAVQADDKATQQQVDDAKKAVEAAIEALEEKSDDFLFDDVKDPGKFYFDPVYWAFYAEPQITKGTDDTHFGPDNACTRGHVVTFL